MDRYRCNFCGEVVIWDENAPSFVCGDEYCGCDRELGAYKHLGKDCKTFGWAIRDD